MNEKKVVVVAVNDAYAPYLSVLIESIVINTDKGKCIEIVVLFSSLSEENQELLRTCIIDASNIFLRFENVGKYFDDINLFVAGKNNRSYLSKETYYRLITPQVLSEYDKILYLDSDIVVQENWVNIFNIDISDYYVAAVNDIWGNWECYLNNSDLEKYRKRELMLDNPINYFNAGVLLINLEKFRKEYKENELLDLAMSKNWRKHDQDLLNYICRDHVKWLDYSWNLIECPSKKAQSVVPKDEYERYMRCYETPFIIHYATRKPWYIFDMMHTEAFWQYAFQTPYKEYLLKQFIQNQMISGSILENYVFEGIHARKIGVVFICKCIITWLKAIFGEKK